MRTFYSNKRWTFIKDIFPAFFLVLSHLSLTLSSMHLKSPPWGPQYRPLLLYFSTGCHAIVPGNRLPHNCVGQGVGGGTQGEQSRHWVGKTFLCKFTSGESFHFHNGSFVSFFILKCVIKELFNIKNILIFVQLPQLNSTGKNWGDHLIGLSLTPPQTFKALPGNLGG